MGLLDDLITRQVKRKEFLLAEKVIPEQNTRKITVKPFITISREAGSGGKPIAKAVAKKLKFKLYDHRLIKMTAEKAKTRDALIASLDERDRSFVEDLVHSFLNPEYVSETEYTKNLFEVILSLARKGNCVILGRGGNFITNQFGGLHVRIVAPFLVRAGYTAQYEGYTIYEARERMKKYDHERKEFIKQYFGKDASNANYYDLVINTTYLQVKEETEINLHAFKQKFPDWKK